MLNRPNTPDKRYQLLRTKNGKAHYRWELHFDSKYVSTHETKLEASEAAWRLREKHLTEMGISQ